MKLPLNWLTYQTFWSSLNHKYDSSRLERKIWWGHKRKKNWERIQGTSIQYLSMNFLNIYLILSHSHDFSLVKVSSTMVLATLHFALIFRVTSKNQSPAEFMEVWGQGCFLPSLEATSIQDSHKYSKVYISQTKPFQGTSTL